MTKEEFKAKANQTIDEVSAKINELKAKKEAAEDGSETKFKESLKELEAKKADLEQAGDEKWEEIRDAFSSAKDSFDEGFAKISSLFS